MNNQNADMASMITTFNIALTETAGEILGKHRQKKTPRVRAKIVDLCNKRRDLKKKEKKRKETEGSEKYREVQNNTKRCMNKAKDNWTDEQCGETEENMRTNNSKMAPLSSSSIP